MTQGSLSIVAKRSVIILFFTLLTVLAVTQPSIGAPEEERVAKLLEGARQEARLVLYTTQSIRDSSSMVKKFEDKYPFIKVDLYRAPSNTLMNKVAGEAVAKRYLADVIEIPGFNAHLLKKQHHTASYFSPEAKAFTEGFKDQDGYWTSTYILHYIVAYNTKLVSRKDMPDTYEGFLSPRWKGKKIGLFDLKEAEWFANMLRIMGEEKGLDFFRRLAAQELAYRGGSSLMTDLVTAGEFPVATVFPQAVEDRKKKGAKVDWVGVAPVVAKLGTIGLTAHPPHPNAARLYIDFCLSKEGQMVLVECERYPARADMDVEKFKTLKALKIYPSDFSMADKFNAYTKQFAEVLKVSKSR